jgi:AraC family transcriptional regulator of adaptative response / DNA-3-methyladenine glycosylase II
MVLNQNVCYQALASRDPRFDGVFFVGVSSTGIYCRTVCTARLPRQENCTFYPSAAAAERAGFRPCLRCRPELAPGNARIDAAATLAARGFSRIEDGALNEGSVADLAAELGITERHLRRVIQAEFGVSPVELAQTLRLLLARRLLAGTDLPVIEVALASGFSSLRRFNALFRQRYRLKPTELRKRRAPGAVAESLACEVAYRPPLDWPALLAYLGRRGAAGVEAVQGDEYLHTVRLGGKQGWLRVRPAPEKAALQVELSSGLAAAWLPALRRVKRLFDLAADPRPVAAHLGPLAARNPGLRVPGAFDGFEVAVRAILGQQTSVRAATTLMSRLVAAFGEPVETPYPALSLLSPGAERLAETPAAALAALGMPRRRAEAIRLLACAVADQQLCLEPGADVEATVGRLQELPGIGEWTAQYIAMRVLGWPDAFPHTDLGIRKALGENRPRRILELAEAWRPWRAYATMHLWESLSRQNQDLREVG